jgi:hypothetical protein
MNGMQLLDKSRKFLLLCEKACFRTRGYTSFDFSAAHDHEGIDRAAGHRIADDLPHGLQRGIV